MFSWGPDARRIRNWDDAHAAGEWWGARCGSARITWDATPPADARAWVTAWRAGYETGYRAAEQARQNARAYVPARDSVPQEKRCTQAVRDAIVEVLAEQYVSGTLDHGELEERTGAALRAKFPSELARLTADLPLAPVAGNVPDRVVPRKRFPSSLVAATSLPMIAVTVICIAAAISRPDDGYMITMLLPVLVITLAVLSWLRSG